MLLAGLPNSEYRAVRCRIDLNDLFLNVTISARSKKDKTEIEREFHFQTDPFDLGAAFLLGLAGRNEALFTWMGSSSSDESWVMRSYWFTRDARQAAVNFLTDLKEKPEVDSKRLDSLIKQLSRDRLLVLRFDPISDSEEGTPGFIFPLSNISMAKQLSEIRNNSSDSARLIGGLRVVVNNGSVSLAAGNSSLLALSDEQRTGLSLSLQRLLEADAVMGMRLGEISFFVPRGEGSVWDKGARISVLGRTVPITDIRDAARLAVVM